MGRGSSVITVLQVHMDNPNGYAGETDSSGIRLYYTPELRPHDIGDVWSGPVAAFFAVPPETPAWDVGHECVWRQEDINIFATRLHMHGLGKAGWSVHKRRGRLQRRLGDVERFDYNYQPALYLDEPVRVRRGDSLEVHCVFDSTGVPEATPAGLETRDEMCIVHHFYYPKRTGFFMEPFCLGRGCWRRRARPAAPRRRRRAGASGPEPTASSAASCSGWPPSAGRKLGCEAGIVVVIDDCGEAAPPFAQSTRPVRLVAVFVEVEEDDVLGVRRLRDHPPQPAPPPAPRTTSSFARGPAPRPDRRWSPQTPLKERAEVREGGSTMTRSLLLGLAVLLAGVAHAAAARHLQQVGRPRPTRPFQGRVLPSPS